MHPKIYMHIVMFIPFVLPSTHQKKNYNRSAAIGTNYRAYTHTHTNLLGIDDDDKCSRGP